MIRSFVRAALPGLALMVLGGVQPASAQYFGRNKVQYQTFDFRILKTQHFDIYFYPAESLATHDAGRMAERWYARHSDTFAHQFDTKSIVLYADHADFEQTNVVGEAPAQGVEGITEGLRTRVVMPLQGSYAETDHVLGHELVHVFQYDIAQSGDANGLARMGTLPGWLIEGMAEYFSLGRNSELTAMWMRDAVERDSFPTINQLNTDPKFFPYRYGQALWAYVAGRWGDRAVVDIYRAALRVGLNGAIVRVLGELPDSLSADWAQANRALYTSQLVGRTKPQDVGERIMGASDGRTEQQNVSPVISPDGQSVAFFSSRSLFSFDLYLADAHTGRIIRKLASPSSDRHFDALNFINSSGAWSPDSKEFAFIVDENGRNNVAVVNVANGQIVRKLSLPGVDAVTGVSWSPDGKRMALAGMRGGISDLYVLNLQTGAVNQLTDDRYADEMPAFSPDGQTIAFATDRGAYTDFQELRYSPLQLATISVTGGPVTVYSPFPQAKEINPQYTPDGRDLLFISNQDGFSDIYRLNLAAGTVTRVTKVATGVSGITETSPALTVASSTGRTLFTVFQGQGFGIYGLEAPATVGLPVEPTSTASLASVLPPGDLPGSNTVTAYLRDPLGGLVSGNDFTTKPYRSSFSLDAISQPSVGVQTGGYFGTGVMGGIAALWGDQLSDRQIYTVLQANGTVKDIGGVVQYLNLRRRWNWSVGVEHVPYLTGYAYLQDTVVTDQSGNSYQAVNYNQLLQRIYIDQVAFNTQYPFSTTRRLELGLSATHLGYDTEIQQFTLVGNQVVAQQRTSGSGGIPTTNYMQGNIALVGDNSNSAYVGPVAGSRWRVQYTPTFGRLDYQGISGDYRRYFFANPFTFAVRGLHYGRYGRDAEAYGKGQVYPVYLGEETLIRGYGINSINISTECVKNPANPNACPVFDRMLGSRVDVINLEFRIPLFGSPAFGLLPTSILPVEIAPFFDAGIAYSSSQPPDFRWTTSGASGVPASCASAVNQQQSRFVNCVDHVPVFSTGVTARVSVLGYIVLEGYIAHPFQRPTRNWVFGLQLAPGW
ncbi:MAG TPA: basic secretory protein-like protein [Gemmatimonadaceae bacterium]|nr:basic secretory protein-like protein [Gemmatimonadaceae bacterium]